MISQEAFRPSFILQWDSSVDYHTPSCSINVKHAVLVLYNGLTEVSENFLVYLSGLPVVHSSSWSVLGGISDLSLAQLLISLISI